MKYPTLPLLTFGRQLFTSQDLDPVYVALLAAGLEPGQRARWLVAYRAFYHSGVASYASEREGQAYWRLLLTAAENVQPTPAGTRWPRGSERRHFRKNATLSMQALRQRYGDRPEDMLDYLASGRMDVRSVIKRARTHPIRRIGSGSRLRT